MTSEDSEQQPTSGSSARTFGERWNEMYQRLCKFKEDNGHCLVPNRYPEDRKLGAWVSAQRRHYKILTSGKKESTPMTLERAQKLIDIGFDWSTSDPRHVSWEDRFEQLKQFKKTYGHVQVPMGWNENPSLSNWVSAQRQDYKLFQKGRPSRLTQHKINQLNRLNFVWEAQRGGRRRKLEPLKAGESAPTSPPASPAGSTGTTNNKKAKATPVVGTVTPQAEAKDTITTAPAMATTTATAAAVQPTAGLQAIPMQMHPMFAGGAMMPMAPAAFMDPTAMMRSGFATGGAAFLAPNGQVLTPLQTPQFLTPIPGTMPAMMPVAALPGAMAAFQQQQQQQQQQQTAAAASATTTAAATTTTAAGPAAATATTAAPAPPPKAASPKTKRATRISEALAATNKRSTAAPPAIMANPAAAAAAAGGMFPTMMMMAPGMNMAGMNMAAMGMNMNMNMPAAFHGGAMMTAPTAAPAEENAPVRTSTPLEPSASRPTSPSTQEAAPSRKRDASGMTIGEMFDPELERSNSSAKRVKKEAVAVDAE